MWINDSVAFEPVGSGFRQILPSAGQLEGVEGFVTGGDCEGHSTGLSTQASSSAGDSLHVLGRVQDPPFDAMARAVAWLKAF